MLDIRIPYVGNTTYKNYIKSRCSGITVQPTQLNKCEEQKHNGTKHRENMKYVHYLFKLCLNLPPVRRSPTLIKEQWFF